MSLHSNQGSIRETQGLFLAAVITSGPTVGAGGKLVSKAAQGKRADSGVTGSWGVMC